jgi:RNA polymerase sigma-70 factor (ECF subfamily)
MVAKNHCLMKIRDRQGKTNTALNEKLTLTPEETADRQALLQNDTTLDLMTTALQELNTEQKRCVTLFYLQQKSYQEISDQTGYSMMQVKSYIQNGKRNLKILLEKKLAQEGKTNANS